MTRPFTQLDAAFNSGTVDITSFARDGLTVSRGNTQIVTNGFVADPGTLDSPLDNITRRFDPNYAAGPYGGGADLVPRVGMAAFANWNATPYGLLVATADGWPQSFPLDGADQSVALQATDATNIFSNASLYISRPAEYSGARIQAVVDAVGWAGPTSIAHGNCIIGPLNLGSVSAWPHMEDVTKAEWGDLYIANDGTLTFRSRDQILSETRSSVSQATYVQNGTDGFAYSGITLGSPPVVNDCTITHNDTGDEVNAQDADSIAAFGVCSASLSLPIHTRSQAQQYADWMVTRFKTPITTFASVTFTPSNEPGDTFDTWTEVLTRELCDLVTVNLDPLILDTDGITRIPSGDPIVRDCWIRGIQPNFSQEPYSVTFFLQDASWIAGLWKWDVSTWDGPDVWAL